MLCRCSSLPIENNKHPNFEWMAGGGERMWIILFSEVTPMEDSVSKILSLIVVSNTISNSDIPAKSTSAASIYSRMTTGHATMCPSGDTYRNFWVGNPVVWCHLVRNPVGQRSTWWSTETAERVGHITDVIQKAPRRITTVQRRNVLLK